MLLSLATLTLLFQVSPSEDEYNFIDALPACMDGKVCKYCYPGSPDCVHPNGEERVLYTLRNLARIYPDTFRKSKWGRTIEGEILEFETKGKRYGDTYCGYAANSAVYWHSGANQVSRWHQYTIHMCDSYPSHATCPKFVPWLTAQGVDANRAGGISGRSKYFLYKLQNDGTHAASEALTRIGGFWSSEAHCSLVFNPDYLYIGQGYWPSRLTEATNVGIKNGPYVSYPLVAGFHVDVRQRYYQWESQREDYLSFMTFFYGDAVNKVARNVYLLFNGGAYAMSRNDKLNDGTTLTMGTTKKGFWVIEGIRPQQNCQPYAFLAITTDGTRYRLPENPDYFFGTSYSPGDSELRCEEHVYYRFGTVWRPNEGFNNKGNFMAGNGYVNCQGCNLVPPLIDAYANPEGSRPSEGSAPDYRSTCDDWQCVSLEGFNDARLDGMWKATSRCVNGHSVYSLTGSENTNRYLCFSTENRWSITSSSTCQVSGQIFYCKNTNVGLCKKNKWRDSSTHAEVEGVQAYTFVEQCPALNSDGTPRYEGTIRENDYPHCVTYNRQSYTLSGSYFNKQPVYVKYSNWGDEYVYFTSYGNRFRWVKGTRVGGVGSSLSCYNENPTLCSRVSECPPSRQQCGDTQCWDISSRNSALSGRWEVSYHPTCVNGKSVYSKNGGLAGPFLCYNQDLKRWLVTDVPCNNNENVILATCQEKRHSPTYCERWQVGNTVVSGVVIESCDAGALEFLDSGEPSEFCMLLRNDAEDRMTETHNDRLWLSPETTWQLWSETKNEKPVYYMEDESDDSIWFLHFHVEVSSELLWDDNRTEWIGSINTTSERWIISKTDYIEEYQLDFEMAWCEASELEDCTQGMWRSKTYTEVEDDAEDRYNLTIGGVISTLNIEEVEYVPVMSVCEGLTATSTPLNSTAETPDKGGAKIAIAVCLVVAVLVVVVVTVVFFKKRKRGKASFQGVSDQEQTEMTQA